MERKLAGEESVRDWRAAIEKREAKVDREAQKQSEMAEVEKDREIVERWINKLVDKNRR